jgi:eukaryotic-like serine/threonine-protein kinase
MSDPQPTEDLTPRRGSGAGPGSGGDPEATIDLPKPPSSSIQAGMSIGAAAGGAAIGRSIGPYRLLAILGEGGFGVVYLAERREPHIQRVALKVIKPGMDSTAVVNRFAAERQALAVMDHPSIARVFDGGTTSDGRPYFVMEYVKGEPITRFCDRERFGIEERLKLFITVCEAVQHAHGKGVIHRDLKPSNVLVEFEDGRATPKIIDFGVAKALHQRLTEGTVYTEIGQFIGTPEYMSPEQAEMTGVDIDTRSDVYTLGVMLYELVAGVLPFDGEKLREGGYLGIQKTIREVDPPKPSQRYTTIAQTGAETARTVASARRADPPSLSKRLRGDLDWVVMRCLEKDRARRYQTANDLAAELQRVLDDEPVLAGPPSVGYRMSKFVRRHRAAVGAAAVAVLALIVATAVSIVFAVREASANRTALEERDRAREAERVAAEEAERARIAAATSERISQFTTGILEGVNPAYAGELDKTLVRKILDDASARIDRELAEDPQVQAALRDTIGGTFLALGEYELAEPQLETALEVRRTALGSEDRRTLTTRDKLAALARQSGRIADAAELQREILEARRRALGEDDPDTISSLGNLALALRLLDRFDEAEPLFKEALDRSIAKFGETHKNTLNAMNNMAAMHRSRGRLEEAEELYRRAMVGQRNSPELGRAHPETLGTMNNLAVVLQQRKKFDEAEDLLIEVVETRTAVQGPDHPETAVALNNLGSAQLRGGRFLEAGETLRLALANMRRRLGVDDPNVMAATQNLAVAFRRAGQPAEAETVLRAMLAEFPPGDSTQLNNARLTLGYLRATLVDEQGRLEDAERLFGLEVLEARRRIEPDNLILSIILLGHGDCQRKLGKFTGAELALLESRQIAESKRGIDDAHTRRVAQALVRLYEAWDEAEPGKGHAESAATWRNRGGG